MRACTRRRADTSPTNRGGLGTRIFRGDERDGTRTYERENDARPRYLANVEKPTLRVALSVLGMSLGTVLASLGEAHFVLKGFIIMCFAETSEATRLVLTQRLLSNLRFGAFEGL